jgi:HEAT repeat protein/uncharacterized protein YegL
LHRSGHRIGRRAGRALVALLLVVAIGAPVVAAPATDDEWKEIEKEFKKQFHPKNGKLTRIVAIETMAKADRADCVEHLIKIIAKPERPSTKDEKRRDEIFTEIREYLERAAKNNNQLPASDIAKVNALAAELAEIDKRLTTPDDIVEAATFALGTLNDAAACKAVLAEAEHKDWEVRVAVGVAMGWFRNAAVDSIPTHGKLLDDKDSRVRTVALDAIGMLRRSDFLPKAIARIGSPFWQEKAAAIAACGRVGLPKAIKPLIDQLEKEDGRFRGDIDSALWAITGETRDGMYLRWKGWWDEHGKAVEAGTWEKPSPAERADAGGGASTFYGIPILSKRIVFVIDCSGSMSEAAKAEGGQVITGGEAMPPDLKTKLDVAKWQLKKAINKLEEDATFNVITYENQVKIIYTRKPLVDASDKNKKTIIAEVDKLEPFGGTNIYDALEMAYNLNEKGTFDENDDKTADTIFFLTGGKPTSGKYLTAEEILAAVKRLNRVRKMTINTISIGEDADKDLMRNIALLTGGTFAAR